MDREIRLAERSGLDSQHLKCRAGRHIVQEVKGISTYQDYMCKELIMKVVLKTGLHYTIRFKDSDFLRSLIELEFYMNYRLEKAAKELGQCVCGTVTNPEHFMERLRSFRGYRD